MSHFEDHHADHAEEEPSHLPFFRSPLREPEELKPSGSIEDGINSTSGFRSESTISFALPMDTEKLLKATKKWKRLGSPRFRHLHQATNLELFYDLFFVANLTTFTYVHQVDDAVGLTQYVGFFTLLWFTWYHVSLYDVRFAMDSVFERICKATQFLVMMGYALCGPEFNVGEQVDDGNLEDPSLIYFRWMTVLLCISRVILVIEYIQMIWFARNHRRSIVLPLVIVASGYAIAAIIYICLYFTFLPGAAPVHNFSFLGWYITAGFETILATSVSLQYRNLSYKRTHLVERLGLLTLIILGEGAIAIAKACQYLTEGRPEITLTGSVGVQVFCAVIILYCLYMLYFDWQHEGSFGSIRQQIWSVFHYPLHVALVLSVEGMFQAITWNASVRRAIPLLAQFDEWNELLSPENNPTAGTFQAAASAFNQTAYGLLNRQLAVSDYYLSTQQGIAYLFQVDNAVYPTISNGTSNPGAALNALGWLESVLLTATFKIEGFYPIEQPGDQAQAEYYAVNPVNFATSADYTGNRAQNIDNTFRLFEMTFDYLYVSIGFFILGCAILVSLNRWKRRWDFILRLGIMAAVGVGIALVPAIGRTNAMVFVTTPWMLPMIMLLVLILVIMMNIGPRPPKHEPSTKGLDKMTPCHSAAPSIIAAPGAMHSSYSFSSPHLPPRMSVEHLPSMPEEAHENQNENGGGGLMPPRRSTTTGIPPDAMSRDFGDTSSLAPPRRSTTTLTGTGAGFGGGQIVELRLPS